MSYLFGHWSFDPMLIGVLVVIVAHELGLSRLKRRSTPANTRRRRYRSLVFYGGLAVMVAAIVSPIDYWASDYFWVHMIEHVMLAISAPMLIVLGAPWIPLVFALPVTPRRRLVSWLVRSPGAHFLRVVGQALRNKWVALVGFNAVMVLWHLPGPFESAESNSAVHIWLMHGSFIVTGLLFWMSIFDSYPLRATATALWKVGAILVTNLTMTVLAMSMSILTTSSWYANYAHVPGVTFPPFDSQQIGAAILWVCGDIWALPALIVVFRQLMRNEGSISDALERMLGRSEPAPA